MCYQVVEIYEFCRCLYYKHAIDPCAAHGQRGHAIQQKTVLVGYSCSSHSGPSAFDADETVEAVEKRSNNPKQAEVRTFAELAETRNSAEMTELPNFPELGEISALAVLSEVPDLVDDDSDSADSSNDADSTLHTAIALSPATSFMSTDEDTVQDILHVLLEDPTLRWKKLADLQRRDSCGTEMKDVKFFLKAFEMDLRAKSDTMLEHYACAVFRRRLQFFSTQICEHFGLLDVQVTSASNHTDDLQPKTLEDSNATAMPPFSRIRDFLFCGDPFQGLKDNLRNYTKHTRRDLFGKMVDIITKNIHSPDLAVLMSGQHDGLQMHLETFILSLAKEAALCNLSASDRSGLRSLQCNLRTLATYLRAFWARSVPVWHFYPLIIGFEAFTVSSNAFSSLSQALAYPNKETAISRIRARLLGLGDLLCKIHHPPSSAGEIAFTHTCPCGNRIVDYYKDASAEAPSLKQKQLRLLTIRQHFQHTASNRGSKGSEMTSSIGDFFASFAFRAAPEAQLPQHHASEHGPKNTIELSCPAHMQINGHRHNFIHWCIPRSRYATQMFPLQSCKITTIVEFFRALRQRYDGSRRSCKSWLSFRTPIALRFVKFRLHHHQLVDIQNICDIPPESRKHEYDYSPMPAETMPPIGPNLLMHFFEHPEEAPSQSVLLKCIPKRNNDKLEPCPIAGSSTGWGIDVITGPDELKFFGIGLFGSLFSIAFGLTWAAAKRDIQGGFAVAGFMLTLFVFGIASLKALDF